MPMVRLSPGGWGRHVKNYYCCLRIMCFFIINGRKWLVSCGASSPGHRQTTDPIFISVTEVLMHMANLPGTRFILCTRNLLWNMNHTSFWDKPGEFSIVMENWLWECFIPAAVPHPDHCQRREMLRKEIDGSYIWRFASTPECCSCSAQPLAEWWSGCVRVIEWWCVSVLGWSQCLLTLHGQPNLTRAGTDGGTLWYTLHTFK